MTIVNGEWHHRSVTRAFQRCVSLEEGCEILQKFMKDIVVIMPALSLFISHSLFIFLSVLCLSLSLSLYLCLFISFCSLSLSLPLSLCLSLYLCDLCVRRDLQRGQQLSGPKEGGADRGGLPEQDGRHQ